MRLYTTNIINEIKQAIKNKKCKFTRVNSYDELYSGNALYSAGVRVEFKKYPENKRDAVIITHDHAINTEYINEWKECSSHKFLLKDWKAERKDVYGKMPYYHIVYVNENNQSISGIIRLLFELHTDIEEGTASTYIKQYGDIKIGQDYYTIIKLWPSNNIFETTCDLNIGNIEDYKSLYDKTEFDNIYSHENDVTDDIYQNTDISQDESIPSNELF